ncbi:hypothetical protein BV22DRAFT_1050662 [Leucogyrophana mollusca]|uniref:Uncharacterized protein n=1 Tax=Leucogyrophana mollusca TaxID=85980 RepID=A0ACB8B565_9AGAM|nr:hypothetical protein BV22DRAFT_1050662 [Leucogyrophana mollusca]
MAPTRIDRKNDTQAIIQLGEYYQQPGSGRYDGRSPNDKYTDACDSDDESKDRSPKEPSLSDSSYRKWSGDEACEANERKITVPGVLRKRPGVEETGICTLRLVPIQGGAHGPELESSMRKMDERKVGETEMDPEIHGDVVIKSPANYKATVWRERNRCSPLLPPI